MINHPATVKIGEEYKHISGQIYRVVFVANGGTKIYGTWRYEHLVCYAQIGEPLMVYARLEPDFLEAMMLRVDE
jgi:hypothetical protein